MNAFILLAVFFALSIVFVNGVALYKESTTNPRDLVARRAGKWTCILSGLCTLAMILSLLA